MSEWGLIQWLVFFVALYFTIKWAVLNGVKEALKWFLKKSRKKPLTISFPVSEESDSRNEPIILSLDKDEE